MANETAPELPVDNNLPQAPRVPESIRAFDAYGREVLVPRAEWAAQVLPNMLAEAWDNPDQLYGLILSSLNDGFTTEVADASEHLFLTDTIPARGLSMWSAVLLQTDRVEQAEQVLNTYIAAHPDSEDGSVLVNLAKAQAIRGDMTAAEATLWHALEVEPNLDNGLGWYVAMQAEKAALAGIDPAGIDPASVDPAAAGQPDQQAGERAARAALERVAAMPASWRAQLWLARGELAPNNPDGKGLAAARPLYTQALERMPRPVPPDFLMQMSGDLGGSGNLPALLEFTAPHYQPEFHGLPVGNNLIKAYVDTGDLAAAAAIKDQLFNLNRPDWKDALTFWDGEIARRRASVGMPPVVRAPQSTRPELQQNSTPAQPQQMQIGLLRIDGPIWLPPQSPARGMFAPKPASAPTVTFLGGTAEPPEAIQSAPAEIQAQLAEALGRLTRSLPLFFAEQVDLRTAAQGRALLPWAVADPATGAQQPGGFVVSAARWPDSAATQMVAEPGNQTDYVVTVHVDAEVEPWTAELAFLRTADGQRIGELSAEFPPTDLAGPLHTLANEVVELLSVLGPATESPAYELPTGQLFGPYLLRIEQLLAVRCANVPGAAAMGLQGEREILDGELDLCLAAPANVPVRLLLVETYGALSQLRPQVAEQFQPNFLRLITENPIPAIDAAFAPQPA